MRTPLPRQSAPADPRRRVRDDHDASAGGVRRPVVVVVGAGPTGVAVLERIVARAGDGPLDVVLVDPHPPGGGRIWRGAQPSALWANSLVADVSVLPGDASSVPGPTGQRATLLDWVRDVGAVLPAGDPIGEEARRLAPTSFPSRVLVGHYLRWLLERTAAAAGPGVAVRTVRASVLDVVPPAPEEAGARTAVVLDRPDPAATGDGGAVLLADAVVLAQGHLDAGPVLAEAATAAAAARLGLAHLPTGYTADQDLSVLRPGQDVLVRGSGLAFVDLVVLLTRERGGVFERTGGRLAYHPSGREPVLHVGSRRGVPYLSKLGYVWPGGVTPPRFFSPAGVDRRFGRDRPVDLAHDLAPLLAVELSWSHHRELFAAHPERTRGGWEAFAAAFVEADGDPIAVAELARVAVPDPADRFDLAALDRPLAGLRVAGADALQERVLARVRADVTRRHDPAHSADAAVFCALLACFGTVLALAGSGRLTPRSRAEDVGGWWMNLFSYLASGPPGPRLEELVALSEAGVLRWLGPDVRIELDEEVAVFRATTSAHDEVVEARALVEARIPAADVTRSPDPLVRALLARGDACEQVLEDPEAAGGLRPTGLLLVGEGSRVLPDPARTAAGGPPPLFAVGTWVSSGPVAAFSRPGGDAPAHRQNDALAAAVLDAVGRPDPGDRCCAGTGGPGARRPVTAGPAAPGERRTAAVTSPRCRVLP